MNRLPRYSPRSFSNLLITACVNCIQSDKVLNSITYPIHGSVTSVYVTAWMKAGGGDVISQSSTFVRVLAGLTISHSFSLCRESRLFSSPSRDCLLTVSDTGIQSTVGIKDYFFIFCIN